MTKVVQGKKDWYATKSSPPLQNIEVNTGGILKAQDTGSYSLKCVTNLEGPPNGGYYPILLWPSPLKDGTQQAVKFFQLDNTGCTGAIHQGLAEAALRGKCDSAHIIGVHFIASKPSSKPIIEIRHGQYWEFIDCQIDGSYPEVGQQKIAQPDGSAIVDKTQQVGTVLFTRVKFSKWVGDPKAKRVVDRKTGVKRVVYVDCFYPDGTKFSRDDSKPT